VLVPTRPPGPDCPLPQFPIPHPNAYTAPLDPIQPHTGATHDRPCRKPHSGAPCILVPYSACPRTGWCPGPLPPLPFQAGPTPLLHTPFPHLPQLVPHPHHVTPPPPPPPQWFVWLQFGQAPPLPIRLVGPRTTVPTPPYLFYTTVCSTTPHLHTLPVPLRYPVLAGHPILFATRALPPFI